MDKLQAELYDWQMTEHPNSNVWTDIGGVGEEFGELCSAIIDDYAGRPPRDDFETQEEAEMDAIGDVAIYLMQFASKRGYSFEECVRFAADQVLDEESRHG